MWVHVFGDVADGVVCGNWRATPLRMDPETLVTRDATSTILGFSLKDSVKTALSDYYTNVPFVIPAERIFIQSFSTGPTISGLNCTINLPLNKAKEIIALFPRSANNYTVFRNPQYNHLMLTLLNRNFPQKGAHSNSTGFYRMQLESCNLDTVLEPSESFENSYMNKACTIAPMRQRTQADDTDFAMVFNLERQSSNAFFSDPVDSANETISLTGSPQVQGMNGDIYYYLNTDADTTGDDAHKNKACPIVAIVSDTFWLFSSRSRCTCEIALGWNECLQKFYPEVYNRLVSSQ
jgi:hypothetical protein